MHRSRPSLALVALAATTLLFTACGRKDGHAGHDHSKHAHTAPHGGTLVGLGDHAYNLEFVHDAATGKLSVYILDGHAENFIRLKAASFEVVASGGAEKRVLAFKPVANPATGETVGDTSQFDAQADWLRTSAAFDATLTSLEIRGTTFSAVPFNFPKGRD